MNGYHVDLDEVAHVIDRIAATSEDLEALSTDLDHTSGRLHDVWTGRAADAHATAQAEFARGFATMRASLADMDGPYAKLNRMLERVAEEVTAKAPGPDAVGTAVARILAASSPPFRTIVGHDARALVALRQLVPDRLFGAGVRLFQKQGMNGRGVDAGSTAKPKPRGSRISER